MNIRIVASYFGVNSRVQGTETHLGTMSTFRVPQSFWVIFHKRVADSSQVRGPAQQCPTGAVCPGQVVLLNSVMRSCERASRWLETLQLLSAAEVGSDEVSDLVTIGGMDAHGGYTIQYLGDY